MNSPLLSMKGMVFNRDFCSFFFMFDMSRNLSNHLLPDTIVESVRTSFFSSARSRPISSGNCIANWYRRSNVIEVLVS
ncbi:hypothetical protein D3C87_2088180 [compost metagenome]